MDLTFIDGAGIRALLQVPRPELAQNGPRPSFLSIRRPILTRMLQSLGPGRTLLPPDRAFRPQQAESADQSSGVQTEPLPKRR